MGSKKTIALGNTLKLPRVFVSNYLKKLSDILIDLGDTIQALLDACMDLPNTGDYESDIAFFFLKKIDNSDPYFVEQIKKGTFVVDIILIKLLDLFLLTISPPDDYEDVTKIFERTGRGGLVTNISSPEELKSKYHDFITDIQKTIKELSKDMAFEGTSLNSLINEYDNINESLEQFAYLGLEKIQVIIETLIKNSNFEDALILVNAGINEIKEMGFLVRANQHFTFNESDPKFPIYDKNKLTLYKDRFLNFEIKIKQSLFFLEFKQYISNIESSESEDFKTENIAKAQYALANANDYFEPLQISLYQDLLKKSNTKITRLQANEDDRVRLDIQHIRELQNPITLKNQLSNQLKKLKSKSGCDHLEQYHQIEGIITQLEGPPTLKTEEPTDKKAEPKIKLRPKVTQSNPEDDINELCKLKRVAKVQSQYIPNSIDTINRIAQNYFKSHEFTKILDDESQESINNKVDQLIKKCETIVKTTPPSNTHPPSDLNQMLKNKFSKSNQEVSQPDLAEMLTKRIKTIGHPPF
ncbi:MAG: hypothetical protein VW397_06185 [Candidatus Margulisiibacteriota bacterium]